MSSHVLVYLYSKIHTVWRETLVVGKFGELFANYLWRNKIWRIAIWSAPLAVTFWSSMHVTCIYSL